MPMSKECENNPTARQPKPEHMLWVGFPGLNIRLVSDF